MKLGQIVYTVNGKTNKVDTWEVAGMMDTPNGVMVHLATLSGKSYCFLPRNCVFETREKALEIANKR